MNQILENNSSKIDIYTNSKKSKKKYKFLFFISLLMFIFFIILFIISRYNKYKKENFSKELVNSYKITSLYNSNSKNNKNYIIEKLSYNNHSSFFIGLIYIKKIDIIYPIFSTTTDDLLELGPCRLYGPMPNEIGNLCIAGHNNADNTIFGKLYLVNIGDYIDIYDLFGTKKTYIVYQKDEINPNDLSCLNQDTNGLCEITLITCNSIKNTRHIIKAKESI